MSYIKEIAERIDIGSRPDWAEYAIECLLNFEPVLLCSGTIGCYIPANNIPATTAAWTHARKYMLAAGIKPPRLRRR